MTQRVAEEGSNVNVSRRLKRQTRVTLKVRWPQWANNYVTTPSRWWSIYEKTRQKCLRGSGEQKKTPGNSMQGPLGQTPSIKDKIS